MDFNSLLQLMSDKKASDLFISAGIPPSMKIHGKITHVSSSELTPEQAESIIFRVMPPDQKQLFEKSNEANFAICPDGIGRFRVNVYRHQNQIGMVLRRIETSIPSIHELNLPEIIKDISMYRQGLVLIVGATGAGKSTTLAAMIDQRNRHSHGHIISIEDPIEFIHKPASSIITQREVGIDTDSFEVALKNALRQAPDLIVIGEIRTKETMSQAMQFAETGHLCLATLHASNSHQAFDRIMSFFPDDQKQQISLDLSLSLKAIIAQRLVPAKDGKERRVAIECLLNTPLVSSHILRNEIHPLRAVIAKSRQLGMSTFDQSLFELYKKNEISYEEALRNADSANELRLNIKLSKQHDPTSNPSEMLRNASLIDDN
jgi:twitching motility protein PilU